MKPWLFKLKARVIGSCSVTASNEDFKLLTAAARDRGHRIIEALLVLLPRKPEIQSQTYM
jgi:hypothetical protein